MCGRMLVLSYDEVLHIVQEMRAGADNPHPDWPAQRPRDVRPQDEVPLVVAGGEGAPGTVRLPAAVLPGTHEGEAGRPVDSPFPPEPLEPDSSLAGAGETRRQLDSPLCGDGRPELPRSAGLWEVQNLTWGFAVPWRRAPIFNTRIESILEGNALWRDAAAHGRCLVPTRGFFERHGSETVPSPRTGRPTRRQYAFQAAGEPVTWIAGICEAGRFSVVTTAPNRFVAPVHDRMPLVLRPGELSRWMEGDIAALADRSEVALAVRAEDAGAPATGGPESGPEGGPARGPEGEATGRPAHGPAGGPAHGSGGEQPTGRPGHGPASEPGGQLRLF